MFSLIVTANTLTLAPVSILRRLLILRNKQIQIKLQSQLHSKNQMNTQTRDNSPDIYSILSQNQRLRVSHGEIKPILDGGSNASQLLVLIWPQLGDFDNLNMLGGCEEKT